MYQNTPKYTKNGIAYTKYTKIWYIQDIPKYRKICQNIAKKSKYTKNIPKIGPH